MGWDDAPPSADELRPSAGAWDSTPPTKDELEGPSIEGFGRNAVRDVSEAASGIGQLADQFAEHPLDTAISTAKAIPSGLVNEGKRIGVGELLEGNPGAALEKFGHAAYEKPVSTALDVLPLAPAAGKALGLSGDVAKASEIGGEAGKVAETAEAAAPAAEKVAPAAAASAGEAAKAAGSPLDAVRDYVTQKYGKAAAKPAWPDKLSGYLSEEANKLGAKDLGLQPAQMKSLGTGYQGLEKANALVDYAREKHYLDPTLTDTARRSAILRDQEIAGKNVSAIRDIADQRAKPDIGAIKSAVADAMNRKYGAGVEKATAEVKRVMQEFDRHQPTHAGLSEMATDLNKSITNIQKLGQHPGPATDAANLISQLNNDSIRKVLNPQESELYTKSLRDYGATKKLEQVTAGSGRRAMANRANQRGVLGRLWQDALDRGGYRIGGSIAKGMSNAIKAQPSIAGSLPKFFEELAHQADTTVDDLIDNIGMSKGGRVSRDVADFVSAR